MEMSPLYMVIFLCPLSIYSIKCLIYGILAGSIPHGGAKNGYNYTKLCPFYIKF